MLAGKIDDERGRADPLQLRRCYVAVIAVGGPSAVEGYPKENQKRRDDTANDPEVGVALSNVVEQGCFDDDRLNNTIRDHRQRRHIAMSLIRLGLRQKE